MTLFQWLFLALAASFAVAVLVALLRIKEALYVTEAQVDTLRRQLMKQLKD